MIFRVLLPLILIFTSSLAFAGSDCFVGEVGYFAFQFTPAGYSPADGSVIAITSNLPLYSLIGSKFGGDGAKTFALPKIAPVNTGNGTTVNAYICVNGVYPSRAD
jgi:microcystin-dependent protein